MSSSPEISIETLIQKISTLEQEKLSLYSNRGKVSFEYLISKLHHLEEEIELIKHNVDTPPPPIKGNNYVDSNNMTDTNHFLGTINEGSKEDDDKSIAGGLVPAPRLSSDSFSSPLVTESKGLKVSPMPETPNRSALYTGPSMKKGISIRDRKIHIPQSALNVSDPFAGTYYNQTHQSEISTSKSSAERIANIRLSSSTTTASLTPINLTPVLGSKIAEEDDDDNEQSISQKSPIKTNLSMHDDLLAPRSSSNSIESELTENLVEFCVIEPDWGVLLNDHRDLSPLIPPKLKWRYPKSVDEKRNNTQHIQEQNFFFPSGVKIDVVSKSVRDVKTQFYHMKRHIVPFMDRKGLPLYACCVTFTESVTYEELDDIDGKLVRQLALLYRGKFAATKIQKNFRLYLKYKKQKSWEMTNSSERFRNHLNEKLLSKLNASANMSDTSGNQITPQSQQKQGFFSRLFSRRNTQDPNSFSTENLDHISHGNNTNHDNNAHNSNAPFNGSNASTGDNTSDVIASANNSTGIITPVHAKPRLSFWSRTANTSTNTNTVNASIKSQPNSSIKRKPSIEAVNISLSENGDISDSLKLEHHHNEIKSHSSEINIIPSSESHPSHDANTASSDIDHHQMITSDSLQHIHEIGDFDVDEESSAGDTLNSDTPNKHEDDLITFIRKDSEPFKPDSEDAIRDLIKHIREEKVVISQKAYCIITPLPEYPYLFCVLDEIIKGEKQEMTNNIKDIHDRTVSIDSLLEQVRISYLELIEEYLETQINNPSCHLQDLSTNFSIASVPNPLSLGSSSISAPNSPKTQSLAILNNYSISHPPGNPILNKFLCRKNHVMLPPEDHPSSPSLRRSKSMSINMKKVTIQEKLFIDTRQMLSTKEWSSAVLFAHLNSQVIFKIINLLLMEKSLIIYGKNPGVVSAITLGVINLISPYIWEGIYIPLIPDNARELFGAPVPLIIGTTSPPRTGDITAGTAVLHLNDDTILASLSSSSSSSSSPPSSSYTTSQSKIEKMEFLAWFVCLPEVSADLPVDEDICHRMEHLRKLLITQVQSKVHFISPLPDVPSSSSSFRTPRSSKLNNQPRQVQHSLIIKNDIDRQLMSHLPTSLLQNLRILISTIKRYNYHFCGNVLNGKDNNYWRKFLKKNPKTNEEEFFPDLFLEPLRNHLEFQEAIVKTQLFVSFMDRLRREDLMLNSVREYIAHWIYFQILRRKKKPKRDRRSLLKSPFTQNRKSLIKETST